MTTHRAKNSDAIDVKPFRFTKVNMEEVEKIFTKYPGQKQSALMPLLWLAQKQNNNWLPRSAMEHIADLLEIPLIKVLEVATFYTMYNKEPVGKFHVQVCRTTPCWLRGSDKITAACKKHLKIDLKKTTDDGLFTLTEVECLGACVNAPMVQINDDYYEDLDEEKIKQILQDLATGKNPKR